MNMDSMAVPVDSVRRLARLAPLAGLLVLLYVSLCVLFAYGGYLDFRHSIEHQPNRAPYSVAMFASFELLFVLSAFRTWEAATLLRSLRAQPTAMGLERALGKTRDMLLLFFVWLIFTILIFIWVAVQPAY